MPIFDSALVSAALLILAASLIGHFDRASEAEAGPATDATPYEAVEAIIAEAAHFPAAGDDLTMYIQGRFDAGVQVPARSSP